MRCAGTPCAAAVPEDDTQPYDAHLKFAEIATEPTPPKQQVFEDASKLRADYQNVPVVEPQPAAQANKQAPQLEEEKLGGKNESQEVLDLQIGVSEQAGG